METADLKVKLHYKDLFTTFPREVSTYRLLVKDMQELNNYVRMTNGHDNVFVSLYDLNYNDVNKVFFDLDSAEVKQSYNDAVKLTDRLRQDNVDYVVGFSGRKGFHVYAIIKPLKLPPASLKSTLRHIQEYYADGIKTADTHVFGDIRRMVRYPNTLNRDSYSTPLPPDFSNLTLKEILLRAKNPYNDVTYEVVPKDMSSFISTKEYEYKQIDIDRFNPPPSLKLLKPLIRPCIYEAIQEKEPRHFIRVDFVLELMFMGYSEEAVFDVIKDLHWRDFNEKITKYQIHNVFMHKYLPPSCKHLEAYVRCTHCGWRYFWRDEEI